MKTRATVLYEIDKPLVIEELEIPPLSQGQALVKILYSGLCGAQINEIKGRKGPDKYLPHLLGHEASGVVEETGPGVQKVKKGDYVVLTWIKGEGMEASSCQCTGKNNQKVNAGAIATFSQYSVISENRIVKIPKDIPPTVAALLGCAIPTGAGIVKNELNVKEGNSMAIFGVGGVGSSALLYANFLRCAPIIAVDVKDSKLEFAKNLGATHVVNASLENPLAKIKEWTKGKGVDYAIEASSSKEGMEAAFESIHTSGTTVLAGNLRHGDKIALDPFELIKGKRVIGTWGGKAKPDKDIPFYVEKWLAKKIPFEKLISKTYRLGEINQAIEDLVAGKIIRGLIDCQG